MSANGNSGWNRSTGNQPTAKKTKAPARWKGIAAGLAVAVPLVALCLWIFSGGDEKPKEKSARSSGLIKAVAPAPAPKAPTNAVPVVKKVKAEKVPPKPDFLGKVPYSEMTPEQKAIRADYYAYKLKSVDFENPVSDRRGEKDLLIVQDPVQIEFLKYFEAGTMQPPTGRVSNQAALTAIIAGVPINDDDPPDVVEKKHEIKAMLDDLKQYMKDGGNAQDYFKALDRRQELEAETMDQVRANVREFIREGDGELAAAAIRTYNAHLKEKGLPELKSVYYQKILDSNPEKKESK